MNFRTTPWMLLLAAALTVGACGTGGTDPEPDDTGDEQGTTQSPPDQEALHPTRVLVRPAPGEDVAGIAADAGATLVNAVDGTDFYVVQFPSTAAVEDFLESLQGDARIIDVERDRVISSPEGGGATLPAGSEIFEFSIVPDQPELQRIGAPVARTRATGQGVRVGVIDSGVVASHLSLAGRVEAGGWDFVDNDSDPTDAPNGIDDDQDGLIDEGFGHGTFVSSLILAVAPDVMIVPYRVLNSDSTGLASHVANAITMATNDGVQVINLSLGMEHRSVVVGEAIAYARDNGVMVVASAGNTGNEEVTFPATISVATSVTSVDPADVKAGFASYGNDMDICAPGFELYGAYPVADDAAVKWSGTSFSAALMTGAFALVRELNPFAPPPQIIQWIENVSHQGVKTINPELGSKLGEGRLDLDAATTTP